MVHLLDTVIAKQNESMEVELAQLAESIVSGTGLFCSQDPARSSFDIDELDKLAGFVHRNGREQRGIARTNCVDCLDRTNVVQYAVGRVALDYQVR